MQQLMDQIDHNFHASFDQAKAEQTIADMEEDVHRITIRLNHATELFNLHEKRVKTQFVKYDTVCAQLHELVTQKQTLMERMRDQIQVIEDSNQEQIAQVARALMEVYQATHTPKFAVDLPREIPLAMRFSEQEEEASWRQDDQSINLTVMTEKAEEVELLGVGVAFQHQIH